MTGTTTRPHFTGEAFETFLHMREEPEWLTDQRRSAWNEFQQMDWPDPRSEEWLRTDIRLFRLGAYELPLEAPEATTASSLLSVGVELAGHSVALNSHPLDVQLDPALARQGVIFGSMDQLVGRHGELIRRYLFPPSTNPAADRFAALHAACWAGGHFLFVPRGVVVDLPFHALSALSDGGVDLGHVLVVLEDGAQATVLTETAGLNPAAGGLHCGGVQLRLGPGAHLRYVTLQNWPHGVWHFAQQNAILNRDSSLQWTSAALGGKLAKVNQRVELVGAGASCQVNGVLFTEGKQHMSYHTMQHHVAAHCRSDFLYKTALQGRSRTVWRGMIKVDPGAQKTDGYQRNDNLLLSNRARADSIPGLEIEADDVRCTHGSTTGKVEEELIFYAQCRGYTRREAARMIVTGFFQQIFDRITIESVRDALGKAIARRVREYE